MTPRSLLARRALTAVLPLALLVAAGAMPVTAQTPAAASVSGTIVDAASSLPLSGVTVSLEPRETGALPAPARGRSGTLAATWTTRSDSAGSYRFTGVADGQYRLRVQRMGYHPATVEISLRGAAASRVSVGLTVRPVALEPLEARALAAEAVPNPYGRRADDAARRGDDRVRAEQARQRRFLAPDVRAVTGADVEEGVTLAESDLFRALQRLPGVAARDDYSAELWTRGAPWDHTRVYFDGMPLYHPVHGSGLLSGIGSDAVGAVFFHPGAQPVSLGGGAAATLDLRSRRGGQDGGTAGVAELSLASARVAVDGSAGADGQHGWMLAARHSHTGWLLRRMEARARERDAWATSRFADVAGRADLRLGEQTTLETSALWQRDAVVPGADADWEDAGTPRWGSLALRATVQTAFAGTRARLTAGTSRFHADVRPGADSARFGRALLSWPTLFAARSNVRYAVLEGSVEPRAGGDAAPAPWSAGAGLARHAVAYDGPPPFPLDHALPPTPLRRDGALPLAFAWGEGRWSVSSRLAVEGGLRVEAGDAVAGGGALRWSPRVAARLRTGPRVSLSAAAGRTHQYVQAGPELGEQSFTQHLWLLAGDEVPVLRSDVATVGAEAWLGGSWLASVTAYERRSTGVATPDPRPGPAIGRAAWTTGTLEAEGVEVGVRRLSGRWTASGAYSWGVSTLRAEGVRFPSPASQRHTLDLAARTGVGRGVEVGAAFTAASGAALTRFFGGMARCIAPAPCAWSEEPLAGAAGALRGESYASLDLLVDWSHDFGRWRLGAFGRLHNALDRPNQARYTRTVLPTACTGGSDPSVDRDGCPRDQWSAGLPRLPVAGVRVTF